MYKKPYDKNIQCTGGIGVLFFCQCFNASSFYLFIFNILVSFFITSTCYATRPSKYPNLQEIKSMIDAMTTDEKTGTEGYFHISETIFDSKMDVAFIYVRKALGKEKFNQLNWGSSYNGSPGEYLRDKKLLTERNNDGLLIYESTEGLTSFIDLHYSSKIYRGYKNAAAVLTSAPKKELKWPAIYNGTTTEFYEEMIRATEKGPNDQLVYKGVLGSAIYAALNYDGNISKSIKNVRATLSKKIFKSLEWTLDNNFSKLNKEVFQFLFSYDEKSNEYHLTFLHKKGQAEYADVFTNGDMELALSHFTERVPPDFLASSIGWSKLISGSSQRFRAVREEILATNRFGDYQHANIQGFRDYAQKKFNGDVARTLRFVNIYLSPYEFGDLGWHDLTRQIAQKSEPIGQEVKKEKSLTLQEEILNIISLGQHEYINDEELNKMLRTIKKDLLTTNKFGQYIYYNSEGFLNFVKDKFSRNQGAVSSFVINHLNSDQIATLGWSEVSQVFDQNLKKDNSPSVVTGTVPSENVCLAIIPEQ